MQLLIWFTSGFVMSVLPIEHVRGEHLVDKEQSRPLPVAMLRQFPSLPQDGRPISTITFRTILDQPVAAIAYADGRTRLVDLASRRELKIDAILAEQIARSAYKGPPVAARTQAVTANSTEYRGAVPAWQVAFGDADSTRVFVDPASGRIAAVRTATWRLYDFFWGLHIMDWKDHENFNTPWLLGFALGGLLLGVAGTILLYFRWPRRRRRVT